MQYTCITARIELHGYQYKTYIYIKDQVYNVHNKAMQSELCVYML